MRRRFHGGSFDEKLDSAGRVRFRTVDRARRPERRLRRGRGRRQLEIWSADAWSRHEAELDAAAAEIARASRLGRAPIDPNGHPYLHAYRASPSPRRRACRAARPSAGRACGRLHLRRRRPRPSDRRQDRPTGTLVCIDRDPVAEQRFAEFAADAPADTLPPRRLRGRLQALYWRRPPR